MESLKSYEITFILKEDESTEGVKKILIENDVKIAEEIDLGSKSLAYEIKKSSTGHFYRIIFNCQREFLIKIESQIAKQNVALRHLIVCVLRKPKETGERIIPKTGARDNKSSTVIGKPIGKKTEMPELEKTVEQPEEIKVKEEVKEPIIAPKKADEQPAVVNGEAEVKKPAKKSETENKKRVTKKTAKAEASELDKKLEELVKED